VATKSFDKSFVVTEAKAIQRFKSKFGHTNKVVIKQRDVSADTRKGIGLLKKVFVGLYSSVQPTNFGMSMRHINCSK